MEMNHYKDADGKVYGFAADGSQHHLMPPGLTAVSIIDAAAIARDIAAAEFEKEDYVSKRIYSYPEIGEFLDAWVKNDQIALEEYRQKCLAVKAKYPKDF
jgi:hypothetical protein